MIKSLCLFFLMFPLSGLAGVVLTSRCPAPNQIQYQPFGVNAYYGASEEGVNYSLMTVNFGAPANSQFVAAKIILKSLSGDEELACIYSLHGMQYQLVAGDMNLGYGPQYNNAQFIGRPLSFQCSASSPTACQMRLHTT